MDTKELVHCVRQIEKSHAEGNYENIWTLLRDLEKRFVTAEQLETTDVVKVLYRVKKNCSDQGVKKTARSLLSKWKKQYKKPEEGESSEPRCQGSQSGEGGSGQGSSSKSALEGYDSRVEGQSELPDPGSSDSVRAKCVQLLFAALRPESPDREKATRLSGDIERHLHQLHGPNQAKYKSCVRSKVANLRNPKSVHLRQGLLSGSLSARDFVGMSAEEMAGAELRQLRREISKRGVNERQLPQGVEGTPTSKVRCQRCGGSDCSVTQVSRGALFLPAWVRR